MKYTMLSFDAISLPQFIEALGYAGLFAVVFAESGVFVGFFFPGDSLLFTAGLLASRGVFDIALLIALLSAAAVLGDSAGYWFGAKAGPTLFSREDSLLFHKKHLESTRKFYARYGSRAVFLARFVPIVRTFAPIFAGIGSMRYSVFLAYNIAGGIAWSAGCTLIGYLFGAAFPGSERLLLPATIAIVLLSILPIARELLLSRKRAS